MSAVGQLQRFLIANRHARDEQQVVRSGMEEPSLTLGDLRTVFAIAIEARQRTDPEEGLDPKGESAGLKGIAQGPSQ